MLYASTLPNFVHCTLVPGMQDQQHWRTVNALIAQGIVVCKTCGVLYPDLGTLRRDHLRSARHLAHRELVAVPRSAGPPPGQPSQPAGASLGMSTLLDVTVLLRVMRWSFDVQSSVRRLYGS